MLQRVCREARGADCSLCDMVWEVQRCIAPLVGLNGDDIVEASLLEPTGYEPRTSPTPEEEADLLGKDLELPKASEAVASLQECPETLYPEEPTKQINTLSIPRGSFIPYSKSLPLPSWKTKNPGKGLNLTWTS